MKSLHLAWLAVLLTGLLATSCKKETKTATGPERSAALYARTLTVYDADRSNSATLRFQSASKARLDELALDDVEFTLVKTPRPAPGNATAPNIPVTFGKLNFSEKNAEQQKSPIDALQVSDKVIYVDLLSGPKSPSLSVEFRNKPHGSSRATAGRPSEETLYPSGVQMFFHGSGSWHRIQIDNLSTYPLNVAFYYNSCDGNLCSTNGDLKGTFTRYSGYSYTLYLNGWAWYYNCNKAVGALISIAPNNGYWYRWTWWTNCTP